jgi:hypothetical protein
MGNSQQAIAYYQQAIDTVEMHSTDEAKLTKISAWTSMCKLHHELKDYTKAIACY